MQALVRRELKAHQRIIFDGNGYTDDWIAEAARRGLPNIRSMVDAIPEIISSPSIHLFERQHVYTAKELHARADVSCELYSKTINIEALTMIDMAGKDFLPAVMRYAGELADTVNSLEKAGIENAAERDVLTKISVLVRQAHNALAELRRVQHDASLLKGMEQAQAYRDQVVPAMTILRAPVDHLEMICDGAAWPVPTYGELLFNV